MTSIQKLFALGMKRDVPKLLEPDWNGLAFDCGASGKFVAPGAVALGAPDWVWPRDPIPCLDGEASIIHAYHFLEHLKGEDALEFLKETQRALMVGGILQFCIPNYSSSLASQDLTHRTFWSLDTFSNTLNNKMYDASGCEFKWKLRVHAVFLMAVKESNMSILGQIVREE